MRKSLSIVMLVGILGLAACGSSDNPSNSSDGKPAQAKPVTAHPAVGSKSGVVRHGTSLEKDPVGDGVKYECKSDMDSIKIPFMKTVDYNGTNIEFKSESDDYSSSEPGVQQDSATLRFSGNLTSFRGKAVSLIVDVTDVYYDEKEKARFSPVDMSVVNLTPEMITNGVSLETMDFVTSGYIGELTICAKR